MNNALSRFIHESPAMFKPGERLEMNFGPETIAEYSLHDIVDEIDKIDLLDDYAGEKADLLGQLYMQKLDHIVQPGTSGADAFTQLKNEVLSPHQKERQPVAATVDKLVRCYAVS